MKKQSKPPVYTHPDGEIDPDAQIVTRGRVSHIELMSDQPDPLPMGRPTRSSS